MRGKQRGARFGGLMLVTVLATALIAPAAAPAATSKRGPYAVGERSYTFVDKSRRTASNGSYPGAATRTLPVLVLYPTKGKPDGTTKENAAPVRDGHGFPLVVFSHGFTASGPVYRFLLERYARRGYVVAAPTFPLSRGGAPGGPKLVDYVNQPADVSFVIDRMLRLERQSKWRKTIDRRSVGAAGHSLGAITTLGVATNSCCLDKRIDAAVAFSGLQLPFANGTGRFYSKPTPPLMVVHGDDDGTVPYTGSVTAYDTAPAPKVLLRLLRGPHTPFVAPWLEPTLRSTIDFLDGYLKDRRKSLKRLRGDGTVPGVSVVRADFKR